MAQPAIVCIAFRGCAKGFPAGILCEAFLPPVRDVERRVSHDVIELHGREGIFDEAALIVPFDVRINAAYGEVHTSKTPCCVVSFLSVDRDLALCSFDVFCCRNGLR